MASRTRQELSARQDSKLSLADHTPQSRWGSCRSVAVGFILGAASLSVLERLVQPDETSLPRHPVASAAAAYGYSYRPITALKPLTLPRHNASSSPPTVGVFKSNADKG
uniref:Uncharacterized protein n=1 Tax=Calcidiscus leptoporus TaxID=127549 RepID=A0A7S0JK49_9EUKA